MLLIKANQYNTLVVTVSQNAELTNPEWLFSFTHIFSKQSVSFIPTDISTHKSRYDEFEFVEGGGVGQVAFPFEGLYIYGVYEQTAGSGNLNPELAYNKVETGQALVIYQSANTVDSNYIEYISNNEDNANFIFAPDELNPSPTPSITASVTPTITSSPTVTPTVTPTITCPVTTQYLEVQLSDNTKFKLILWNNSNYTGAANANCNYVISGSAYGSLGTVYNGQETISTGQHQHQFDLAPVLLPGETVTGFTVSSYTLSGCPCPVDLIFPIPPTPTPTITPTNTNTPTVTTTPTITPSPQFTTLDIYGVLNYNDIRLYPGLVLRLYRSSDNITFTPTDAILVYDDFQPCSYLTTLTNVPIGSPVGIYLKWVDDTDPNVGFKSVRLPLNTTVCPDDTIDPVYDFCVHQVPIGLPGGSRAFNVNGGNC